jgi:hypothetical protein
MFVVAVCGPLGLPDPCALPSETSRVESWARNEPHPLIFWACSPTKPCAQSASEFERKCESVSRPCAVRLLQGCSVLQAVTGLRSRVLGAPDRTRLYCSASLARRRAHSRRRLYLAVRLKAGECWRYAPLAGHTVCWVALMGVGRCAGRGRPGCGTARLTSRAADAALPARVPVYALLTSAASFLRA